MNNPNLFALIFITTEKILSNMKLFPLYFVGSLLLFSFFFSSCEPEEMQTDCNGKGKLTLKNTSTQTLQRVMINGISYGTLDPGESETYELIPGHYTGQQVGISGGSGCTPFSVNVTECSSQTVRCGG